MLEIEAKHLQGVVVTANKPIVENKKGFYETKASTIVKISKKTIKKIR